MTRVGVRSCSRTFYLSATATWYPSFVGVLEWLQMLKEKLAEPVFVAGDPIPGWRAFVCTRVFHPSDRELLFISRLDFWRKHRTFLYEWHSRAMTERELAKSEDCDTTSIPITALCIVSDKNKCPKGFTPVFLNFLLTISLFLIFLF